MSRASLTPGLPVPAIVLLGVLLAACQPSLLDPSPAPTVAMETDANRAPAPSFVPPCCLPQPAADTERYLGFQDQPLRRAADEPVSTFSIDVDTAAYANVRRFLTNGQLPPPDAVRVEEMLNYFDYRYPEPDSRDTPFRLSTELAVTPWNSDSLLLRIGLRGYDLPPAARPPVNLVFLIDVSGSMQSADKLPLLRSAFRLLVQQLSARDRVALVVYAGATGVVLEPTAGDQRQKILGALAGLEAGGSTNGGAGIDVAYRLARDHYAAGAVNRVILATDGDFNVGTVDFNVLVDRVARERATGVELTTLGFGTGNYNDGLLERLADAGNGNHAYIDGLAEARKVLVDELSSTLVTLARDVKIQVEFNPSEVEEYRLIGYENRTLAREDFNNDRVDAGEIGAGHRVTALYEIVPRGRPGRIDPLRYATARTPEGRHGGELAFLRLRYKPMGPPDAASRLIETPVSRSALRGPGAESADFRFAASVAAFGQKLRGGKYLGAYDYAQIAALAATAADGGAAERREYLSLVELAASLDPRAAANRGEPARAER